MAKAKQRGFIRLHDMAIMPRRQTKMSAGYDIHALIDMPVEIRPGEMAAIPTGLSCYMLPGEEMQLRPRSGLGYRYQVTIQNSPATIDADWEKTGQDFKVLVRNEGKFVFTVNPGDRIAQAVFGPYYTTDDDDPVDRDRESGLGHTGK